MAKSDGMICGGLTKKGESCTRKGIHGGFCYQHEPKSDKAKSDKSDKKVKSPKKCDKSEVITYKMMVARSIMADSEKKGTSRQSIKKYMSANYKIESSKHFLVNGAIKKMVAAGEIIPNSKHTGHFRLEANYKKSFE